MPPVVPLPPSLVTVPVAHRGLHDRTHGVIENSRAAAAAAVAAGYGIELDVQLSADGEAMVFHDDSLSRLTAGTGLVRDHPEAVLSTLSLTGAGGGETIPTLGEILSLVAGRVPLVIEVKDQDGGLGPDVGPLEIRVAKLLADYPGEAAVMSFNPHAVAVMAEAAPDRPRGLTTCDFAGADWSLPDYRRAELASLVDVGRVGASFISHDRRDLRSEPVGRVRDRGLTILTWTVRSPAEEEAARRVAANITFEGYHPALHRR